MKICMIGAGYVGLVSAACFSEFGWTVTCVDKDEARLAELGRGISPIYERDTFEVRREKRIGQDDEYFKKLSSAWSDALRQAFGNIEEFKI